MTFFYILGICFVKGKSLQKVIYKYSLRNILLIATMIEDDDMQILKSYVFRMYLTEKQEWLINKT